MTAFTLAHLYNLADSKNDNPDSENWYDSSQRVIINVLRVSQILVKELSL